MKRLAFGCFLLFASAACGQADNVGVSVPFPTGDGGAGGSAGGSDNAAAPAGVGGAGASGPAVCPDATGVYAVDPSPSNILFVVDRSGSMHLDLPTGGTRWTETKAGLFALFDALPAETVAGLTMFPTGDDPIDCCIITDDNIITCGGCADGELPAPAMRCDAAMYHDLPVPLAELDAPQNEMMKAFASTVDDEFYWGTPLAPALQGALQALGDANIEGVNSVVLLTDGKPTSCDTPSDPTANEIQRAIDAASAAHIDAAIRTFVLGVVDGELAADASNLSAIALAGGTNRYPGCDDNDDCAYSINVDNFEDDLFSALEAIALEAISCSFDLPEVEQGTADLDTVNITVTAGGDTTTVPRDTTHSNGWDYLPGEAQVQLYGPSCELLKETPDAQVTVVVGCDTVDQ